LASGSRNQMYIVLLTFAVFLETRCKCMCLNCSEFLDTRCTKISKGKSEAVGSRHQMYEDIKGKSEAVGSRHQMYEDVKEEIRSRRF
jgi:hypothetical protein